MFKSNKDEKNVSNKEVEALKAVKVLLDFIGENTEREGLKDTPKRFISAFKQMLSGYKVDPKNVLNKTFKEIEHYNGLITLGGIDIKSYCEHHLMPFIGTAYVAYQPNGAVVGISKIIRLVQVYSKRLQIQERLTAEIAHTLYNVLQPKGVGVFIKAKHLCMMIRGVENNQSIMCTNMMLGSLKNDENTKQQFFNFIKEYDHKNI